MPHIDWENSTVKTGSNQVNHHQELIEIIEDSGMEQLQLKPSRKNNILDLFLTNQPSLVKSCNTIPGKKNKTKTQHRDTGNTGYTRRKTKLKNNTETPATLGTQEEKQN
jgi:hypothetical protein